MNDAARSEITDISQAEEGSSLWQDAWVRLRRNHLAVFGLVVLLAMVVIALLTPWIAPYAYDAQDLDLGATPLRRRTGWVRISSAATCSRRSCTAAASPSP
jgi:ABC-type antimicrobial peptide transport system permease subunit